MRFWPGTRMRKPTWLSICSSNAASLRERQLADGCGRGRTHEAARSSRDIPARVCSEPGTVVPARGTAKGQPGRVISVKSICEVRRSVSGCFPVPNPFERPCRQVMIRILRLLRASAGSDQVLLDRYVQTRDEAAFEALVHRYGNGVWAACARLAGRDAEDAFQAVFLILSRKAGTVSGSLPAWLHAVTRRVASTIRRTSHRRIALEAAVARPELAPDTSPQEGLLDEELSRLPEQYRTILIVCCLEGRSRDEAAEQLGWSEGQVKGRLERAREMLRSRLARRNVELGGLLLAVAVTEPIPVRAAPPSAAAISLTHGVIRAMMIQKLKLAAMILVTCVGVAGGVVLQAQPGDPAPAANGEAKSTVPKERAGEKIKELQKERIATLKDVVDLSTRLAKTGRLELGELLEARTLLLQAELEAAEKPSDRMALYKKSLDDLKEYFELAKSQHEAARASTVPSLKIKAKRLEVEIALEQLKLEETKGSK
jgi:RNA polymerase sigma factor (sigma-70 family)